LKSENGDHADVTDLNTCMYNFVTSATALDVNGEIKALKLTRCLEGTALELMQNLSQEERLDYAANKRLLEQRFRYTEGYYIESNSKQQEPDQVKVRNR